MLGVGRKVGSRNGSRGCCATINTPRDATRHVLLFSTFRSFFFSPSRSAASSLFPTPCACSFFFSLYYSLIPRLSLSLCLFFPFLMLSFPSAPWLYLPPPTRLSSRFSTPFLFSGNLAVFFIFWSVLSLALSPPNCSQPVSFSFRPELSLFFLPLFNPPPLTPCPFHRFSLSYASGSSLLASTSSNLFVFSLSCFHSCFVLYSSLSRPTPSDARAPFLHSLLVQQSWSSCSSIHNIRYLSLPILVVVLQCTSWKIFEIIIFFIS